MFVSIKSMGGDFTEYAITDTDFGTEIWPGTISIYAVLSCYQGKEVDVAYNLYLYHRHIQRRDPHPLEEEDIDWYIETVPEYAKYGDEVKRYIRRYHKQKAFW